MSVDVVLTSTPRCPIAKRARLPARSKESEKVDGRADVFGLGVVLYELACGKRPFDGGSDADTLRRILDADMMPPSKVVADIPEGLERVIVRALANDPKADTAGIGRFVAGLIDRAARRAGFADPTPSPDGDPATLAEYQPTAVSAGELDAHASKRRSV